MKILTYFSSFLGILPTIILSENSDLICNEEICRFTLEIREQLTSTAKFGNQRLPIEFDENGKIKLSTNRFYTEETGEIYLASNFLKEPVENRLSIDQIQNLSTANFTEIVYGAGENQENGSSKTVITINGQFPGPKIVVPENSKVAITVVNKMVERSTSMHWHGLSMENAWYYDGSPISQCPIIAGSSFTYRFLAKPRGVQWYHAHLAGQSIEGLFGLFVVVPEKHEIEGSGNQNFELIDIIDSNLDLQHVKPIMISEYDRLSSSAWINEFQYLGSGTRSSTEDVHHRLFRADGTEVNAIKYDTTLINGRGRADHDKDNVPYEVIFHDDVSESSTKIQKLSKNLLVVLNAGSDWGQEFSVDGHQLEIIEIDGAPITPAIFDFLHISPGERYVIRLKKLTNMTDNNQKKFMIRVEPTGFYSYKNLEGKASDKWLEGMRSGLPWGDQLMEYVGGPNGENGLRKLTQKEKRQKAAFMVYSYEEDTIENRISAQIFANQFTRETYLQFDTSLERCQIQKLMSSDKMPCKILGCNFNNYGTESGGIRPNFQCYRTSDLQAVRDSERADYSDIFKQIISNNYQSLTQSFGIGGNMNGKRFKKPLPPFTQFGSKPKTCDPNEAPGFGRYCQDISNQKYNSKKLFLLHATGTKGYLKYDPHHNFHIHGHKMRILAQGSQKQDKNTGFLLPPDNSEIIQIKQETSFGRQNFVVTSVKFNETFVKDPSENGLFSRINPNGIFRDVVTVPNLGWVLFEVDFNNKGLFHAHCHMMSHSMEGIGMIFKVGNEIPFPPPVVNFPKCGDFLPGTENEDFEKFLSYKEEFPRKTEEKLVCERDGKKNFDGNMKFFASFFN